MLAPKIVWLNNVDEDVIGASVVTNISVYYTQWVDYLKPCVSFSEI